MRVRRRDRSGGGFTPNPNTTAGEEGRQEEVTGGQGNVEKGGAFDRASLFRPVWFLFRVNR